MKKINKNILGVAIATVIGFSSYVASIKGNDIARNVFTQKYAEPTAEVVEVRANYNSRVVTKTDIENWINLSTLNNLYPDHEIEEDHTELMIDSNTDFSKIDDIQFIEGQLKNSEQKERLALFEKIVLGEAIQHKEKRNIKEQIPAFQTYSKAESLMYLKTLSLIKSNKTEEAIAYFEKIHNAKLNQLDKTNMMIFSLVLVDRLQADLKFFKYVKDTYDITLKVKPLKKKHYNLKEAIDSDKELFLSFKDSIATNYKESGKTLLDSDLDIVFSDVDMNYMDQHSIYVLNQLQKYFDSDLTQENVDKELVYNFPQGYIEEYGSPIVYILANVSRPVLSQYKRHFFDYNEKLKELNQ